MRNNLEYLPEYEGDEDEYIDEIKHRPITCSNQSISMMNNISILDEADRFNNGVIMFIRPYNLKKKSLFDIYCFLHSELIEFLAKSPPVFIYRKETAADENFPLYKLPNTGLWIEGNYFLLSRYSAYIVYDPTILPIGSVFGQSALHGAEEKVYRIHPISKTKFLKTKTIDISDLDNMVLKKRSDFAPNNFPNVKVSISKRENSFVEREISRDDGLMESIFERNGSMEFSMFSSGKSHVYLKLKMSYTRENDFYKDRVIKPLISKTHKISKGNKEFSYEKSDNTGQVIVKIKRNGLQILKEKITVISDPKDTINIVKKYIEDNNIEGIKRILWQLNDDIVVKCINIAIYGGHQEIVSLFLKVENLSESTLSNALIAALNTYPEIAEMILADGRADPSVKDNEAIIISSEKGYTDIVQMLLDDPRVDPSAKNNKALSLAKLNNHKTIIELLQADERVDPHVSPYHYTPKIAEDEEEKEDEPSGSQDSPIVISDSEDEDEPEDELFTAIRRSDVQSVSDVLSRYNFSDEALKSAFESSVVSNNPLIVKLFFDKLDPSMDDNNAIKTAISLGRDSIVEVLLEDDRVKNSINEEELCDMASSAGYQNIAEMFM